MACSKVELACVVRILGVVYCCMSLHAPYDWEGSTSSPGERATHGPHSLNSFKMDAGDWVLCAQEQQKGLTG
jgi:hypothetical protein